MIQARIERGLIAPLTRWCEQNAVAIQLVAVCVPASGQIIVYVARRSSSFDFGLSSEITRLELDELERSLPVDVIQVPPLNSEDEVRTFLRSYEAMVPPCASVGQMVRNPGKF